MHGHPWLAFQLTWSAQSRVLDSGAQLKCCVLAFTWPVAGCGELSGQTLAGASLPEARLPWVGAPVTHMYTQRSANLCLGDWAALQRSVASQQCCHHLGKESLARERGGRQAGRVELLLDKWEC